MTSSTTDDTLIGSRFIDDDKLVESSKEILGAVCWAVNSSGTIFAPKCVGKRSTLPDAKAMTTDTVLFLASSTEYVNFTRISSCKEPKMTLKITRLVTAVAAMQSVERGLIGLDDLAGKHLLDLQSDVVIAGWKEVGGGGTSPLLRPAETQMTLRQMLSHTSGISSGIFDPQDEIFKHG
jgi:hypothetical protein